MKQKDWGISRRHFVGTTAAALIWSWHRPGASPLSIESDKIQSNPFVFGVASGDPLPDSVILWTRLNLTNPEVYSGDAGGAVEVEWLLYADEGASDLVASAKATAWPEKGHSVHVDVSGLEPGREYWYRFRCGEYESAMGRTKTANPDAEEVRFGVASCNNYEHGYFTAFDLMARDRLDFIYHAGDYIYEKAPKPGQIRAHRGGACMSLDDYRLRYSQYRLDPSMQAMHHSAPFIASWDDHEVAGNWAALRDKFDTPEEVFAMRRVAAFQAFYEFMPIRVERWQPSQPFPLYRAFTFGGGVQFLVLDTRQYRSDQACDDASWGAPCAAINRTDREMLGERQFEWLAQELDAEPDRWAMIANQIPSYRRNGGSEKAPLYAMDKWDGYPHAQRAFHGLLKQKANGRALVFSGDVHAHFASDLKDDWVSDSVPFGVELSVTSISSGGDGQDYDPMWPHLKEQNPHLHYHSKRRGYLRCRARRDSLQAQFVTLDKVSDPDGKARIDATGHLDRARRGLSVDTEGTAWRPWARAEPRG